MSLPADTPMMRQYTEAKALHPDALLLFRMGDFYELFGEDAEVAARDLGLTLTTRDRGREDPVPMAGVPHHAISTYLGRLIERGHKVAICEQMELPGSTRTLLRREVVRVVTPGTVLEPELLHDKEKNYLAAVAPAGPASPPPSAPASGGGERRGHGAAMPGEVGPGLGLALLELSTGELVLQDLADSAHLADALDRHRPAELLYPEGLADLVRGDLAADLAGRRSPYPDAAFGGREAAAALRRFLGVLSLEAFGIEDRAPSPAARAAGALLAYVEDTQKEALAHLDGLRVLPPEHGLVLDATTRRNLEVERTLRGEAGPGTLLGVIDRTLTPMGGRLLRDWLRAPLTDVAALTRRHDGVDQLVADDLRRARLGDFLATVADLERLINRIAAGRAGPREVLALGRSLARLPELRREVLEAQGELARLGAQVDPAPELCRRILDALLPDPPATAREGAVFAPGFHPELDELRGLARDGRRWIADYEARERRTTGIPSLKVRFNKVFGYFLEVTRANLDRVPEGRYQRKQTLSGAERFTTAELEEYEAKVLGAEERQRTLEQELFDAFRGEVAVAGPGVRQTARALAELDVLLSFARVARERGYVRPRLDEDTVIEIEAGRHPVVEGLAEAGTFVPNDTYLDLADHQLLLLTGPNMSGKSTLLRQVGLITLLAQVGAFVPARRARIGVVDRIFTRVGASDNLARGQSTFLVEMQETAHICRNATRRSLVLLDEIGRGTSTFDGLSLAWAVAEYLHEAPHLGCKTLFATHYHELTELEAVLPRLKNYHVAVKEERGKVVFLRRLERGGIDQSFGIHVAELAGMPRPVVRRAREVLANLEASELDALGKPRRGRGRVARDGRRPGHGLQLTLFMPQPHPVVDALAQVVPEELTPLQALTKLDELRRMVEAGR